MEKRPNGIQYCGNFMHIALNPFARFLTLLTDCNFPLPNPSQPTQIKSQVKKLIPMAEKILNENWDNEIPHNRKLGTYDSIKESHDREGYLEFISDRNMRKNLAILRLSCHSLQIEVGRYKNIPRENRLCNFCPLNEIEDEKHFIFCPLYENLRKDLFDNLDQLDNFTWRRCTNEMEKFLFLVQPCNKEVTLLVCKYLKSCFDLRKEKMSGAS